MKLWHAGFVAASLMAMTPGPAEAHIGFILPDAFDYRSCGHMGAIASFSDRFPAPEIVLASEGFRLIGPDGEAVAFDRIAPDHAMTRLEGSLTMPGTYLLTSGERLGRKAHVVRVEDRYIRLSSEPAENAELPAGAKRLSSQTATVSEAYVSCGGVAGLTSAEPAGRLSITPGQAQLKPGMAAHFTIRFDGAPLQPAEAFLIEAYGAYAGAEEGRPVGVGADGMATFTDLDPGIYALLVRHIAPAPDGSDTDVRSYSTVLTFEVLRAPADRE